MNHHNAWRGNLRCSPGWVGRPERRPTVEGVIGESSQPQRRFGQMMFEVLTPTQAGMTKISNLSWTTPFRDSGLTWPLPVLPNKLYRNSLLDTEKYGSTILDPLKVF